MLKGETSIVLRGLGLGLATICAATAFCQVAQAKEIGFEEVFSAVGEPAALHYRATFFAKGAEHQLEVWRDGETRLKRSSDGAIETYVFHQPGSAEFEMSILDRNRKIRTTVDRTSLYRIGNFVDWFDLAHGLKHPVGAYRLAKAEAPAGAPKPLASCQWYDLTQKNRTTQLCWSARDALPVLMLAQGGAVLWKLTALDTNPIAASTFEIKDEGFIRIDASEEIGED